MSYECARCESLFLSSLHELELLLSVVNIPNDQVTIPFDGFKGNGCLRNRAPRCPFRVKRREGIAAVGWGKRLQLILVTSKESLCL